MVMVPMGHAYGHPPEEDGCDCWTYCLTIFFVLLFLCGGYWLAVEMELMEDHLRIFGPDPKESYLKAARDANESSKTDGGGLKKALIISVTYKDSDVRKKKNGKEDRVGLPGTTTDAEEMNRFLKSKGFMVTWMRDDTCKCNGKDEESCAECRNKTNEYGSPLWPTCKNIKRNLKGLAKASQPGDVLWVFFAGHGSYEVDESGEEADGKDEKILPANYDVDHRYIKDDWLADNFRKHLHRKSETVAVFDCCHSGSMFDLPYILDPDANEFKRDPQNTDKDPEDHGFFLYISGCQDNQVSQELKTKCKLTGKTKREGNMTKNMMKLIYSNKEEANLDSFLEQLRQGIENTNVAKDQSHNKGLAQKPNMCCTRPLDVHKYSLKMMFDGKIDNCGGKPAEQS